MSRMAFSQGRTGRRPRQGGGSKVDLFKFKTGFKHRLVFPLYEDEDGNKQLILFGETYHKIAHPSFMKLPKRGGTYPTFSFRCSHPYSQQNQDDALKIAEKREMCPLCEYENLQNQRRLAVMEEEIGFEEFKELTKAEKKKFYEENPINLEKPFYDVEDSEGNVVRKQHVEMYILALEIATEEKTKELRNKKTGKVRKLKETVPVIKDGEVEYAPVLMKISSKRLEELKTAVDVNLQNETMDFDNLHTFVENEGTEFEEEVNIGWVDFQFSFPDSNSRMESARDVTVTAMTDEKSVVVNNPEFLEKAQEQVEQYEKDALKTFKNVCKHLQLLPREDVLNMFSDEAYNEFVQLREEFRGEQDEEYENNIYDTVLGQVEEQDESEEETEEKPKKTRNKKTKKDKKEEVAEESEEDEEELDIGEEAGIDDDELFEI